MLTEKEKRKYSFFVGLIIFMFVNTVIFIFALMIGATTIGTGIIVINITISIIFQFTTGIFASQRDGRE